MRASERKIYGKAIAFLLIIAVLILLVFSGCSNYENTEINLQNFSADETYFVVGTESDITFTVDVEGVVDSVNLCSDDGTLVGVMHDDGVDGDIAANDSKYTCIFTTTYKDTNPVEYYVKSGNITSDKVTIYSFEMPNNEADAEKAANAVDDVQQDLSNIENNYTDKNGYVDSDSVADVISDVKDYLEKQGTDGDILLYEADDNSIYIKFKSGITLVYEPSLEAVSANGSEVSLTFSAYQPNPDVAFDRISNLANELADEFESSATTYQGEEVTLSRIKELPSNQVVFWNGHGGYGPIVKSFICSGEYFDRSAWWSDKEYRLDCLQDRIIKRSTEKQKNLACVTSKFINYYCGDLSNDLILLASCHSGQNRKLADSFLNKGATAVLGFTDTVYTEYCCKICYYTLAYMTWVNPDTNNYYTLSEAVDKSKSEIGENDIVYAKKYPDTFTEIKSEVATPKIFGGDNAENYRLAEYVPVSASEFTVPDSKVLTIGQIDIIEPEITPEDADDYTIKWTSSDDSIVSVNPTGKEGIVTGKSKGTATITAELTSSSNVITHTTEVKVASKGRDTVLVLDVSGSMSGEPLTEMKKSALQFCNDLLYDEYNNRVAVVCFDDDLTYHEFSNDLDELENYINDISDGGATNMTAALEQAESMLDNDGIDSHIKNIVIMADGLPNRGKTSTSGSAEFVSSALSLFTSDEEFANAVVDTAEGIMKKYNMYSLGFFHSLTQSEYDNCSKLMSKLTNMTDGYHEVDKAENLQFEFGDIADDISDGSRVVINIACPVDVSVSYDGETLSSASSDLNEEASFGTLQLLGKNQDVKVLSLDSDKVYDIELSGTDKGTMDYSVNYIDENDEISDYRNFSSVPITDTTIINSSTDNSTTVNLNIDNNGDGVVDVIWGADSNGDAKIIQDNTPTEPEIIEQVTTEPMSTIADTKPVTSTNNDDNTFMIVIIVLCSVIMAGVIILIVVAVTRKNSNEYNDIPLPTEDKTSPVIPEENNESELKSDATIEILSGSMKGAKVPIMNGEMLALGKNPALCQIVFDAEYSMVSRMHCTVTFDKNLNKFFVTDNSSNGTYFESGRKLEKGKRTPITNDTILYLCDENCAIRLILNK